MFSGHHTAMSQLEGGWEVGGEPRFCFLDCNSSIDIRKMSTTSDSQESVHFYSTCLEGSLFLAYFIVSFFSPSDNSPACGS